MDRTAVEVVLGRYELGEVLGHGGSATVHRAWDRHTERAVALKRFTAGADEPDGRRQRAEVRTLARLDHPGLVRLLDAGTEDGRAHLVMDLVEGPSLDRRLADGRLAVGEVVALGAALADALAAIHARGITHRDVKPANVLLDPVHGPRLADFGIARLVDSTRVTATDAVVGTAAYMAPEQLRGKAVGPAADVYALGLVLLEAATGGLGLPGTGLEPVLTRLTVAPHVPEGLPASLRTLLQTMTDGVPARRPSARQVAAALTALRDDPPPDVGTTVTRVRVGGSWRRAPSRRRRAVAVAAGVLLLVVAAPATVLGLSAGSTPPAPAVVATLPAVGDPPVVIAPGPAPGPAPVAGPGPGPAAAAASPVVSSAAAPPAGRTRAAPARAAVPRTGATVAARPRPADDHGGRGNSGSGGSGGSGGGGGSGHGGGGGYSGGDG